MPYINRKRRVQLNKALPAPQPTQQPETTGELTYVFFYLALRYVVHKGVSFQTLSEIVAALEQAKDEFQRRVIHPYEDAKRKEHGDVYV